MGSEKYPDHVGVARKLLEQQARIAELEARAEKAEARVKELAEWRDEAVRSCAVKQCGRRDQMAREQREEIAELEARAEKAEARIKHAERMARHHNRNFENAMARVEELERVVGDCRTRTENAFREWRRPIAGNCQYWVDEFMDKWDREVAR